MNLEHLLSEKISLALSSLFTLDVKPESIGFQKTNADFLGDVTLVVFPYVRASKKSPEETAKLIGEELKKTVSEVVDYNVVKGFLNLEIAASFWLQFLQENMDKNDFGKKDKGSSGRTVMVEFSSPNTNKPIHLGHMRNNLLGYSVSSILEANGDKVIKANLVNDRGVHICKSMLAWKLYGNGETPASSGMKGDHLVGKYYVLFDKNFSPQWKAILSDWMNGKFDDLNEKELEKAQLLHKNQQEASEKKKERAEAELTDFAKEMAPLMKQTKEMLRNWEAGDQETLTLWKMMNSWVYEGFDMTYKALGVSFDKMYYESNTYLLGKKIVNEGLNKGVFTKIDDGSVWIDLTADGLDKKILLRSDGTSVYMTQDVGTAAERFREFPELSQLIYTVGNEQDYHFKVLFLILAKLGYEQAKNCYHLSYGMVDLPEGRMKSREGTVVDADDLMEEMIATAKAMTLELGKADTFTPTEAEALYRQIGMAALKYFILKVDPKKRMIFDPKESIDFNGNTGPFIQYTHARIQSLLRNASAKGIQHEKTALNLSVITLLPIEKELIKTIYRFPDTLCQAALEYSPGLIANYVFDLTQSFSSFYQITPILKEEHPDLMLFRLRLSGMVAKVIRNSMALLGIEVPEKM
jgi:arginyl-tRNA synthetase